ncbi:DUF6731 family protein [uncultured Deefgea sp.]|uniref:DUF6731 family protein n=1 Tax=uncultured Deefgea sp. TaxID=1304914 RepID=UPI002604E759|nr:DUF6731 family protein [uncultured Deefgea sp.]
MKPKNYKIRYYMPSVGADGAQGSIASLLNRIALMDDGIGSVREAGSMVHQVRVIADLSTKQEYRAAFVRFRDELPSVSKRTSCVESRPELKPDEELIEKNHFVLFVEDDGAELLAYQMSMEGSDISSLARYFTHLTPDGVTVALHEVVKGDAFLQLQNGVVKSIEFEVAKPRSKSYAPDPNDTWTKDAIQFMNSTGATRFWGKIKTTSRTKGLINLVKEQIGFLFESNQTKKLSVRLSGVDHPIDLFADRVFDTVSVVLDKGHINSQHLYTEIGAAKRANVDLAAYLAKGDEKLD